MDLFSSNSFLVISIVSEILSFIPSDFKNFGICMLAMEDLARLVIPGTLPSILLDFTNISVFGVPFVTILILSLDDHQHRYKSFFFLCM